MTTITKIRKAVVCFIALLVLSGLTAFPVRTEIQFLNDHLVSFPFYFQLWVLRLKAAIDLTPDVILYGTDWLAFAHLIIALFFVPVFFDPVKHKANVLVGMTACLAVFPLAFICGPVRNIPFFHQLIDCSFGIGGFILLGFIYKGVIKMENEKIINSINQQVNN